MRPFVAIALALVLVLTAQSMAVARGAPAVAGVITLCTGTGPVAVLTDADGQPVGPTHICPDCSLSLATVPASHPFAIPQPLSLSAVLPPHVASVHPDRIAQPFSARDPPALV